MRPSWVVHCREPRRVGGIGQNSLIAIARCTPAAAQHTLHALLVTLLLLQCVSAALHVLLHNSRRNKNKLVWSWLGKRALNWEETQLGKKLNSNSSRERLHLLKVGEEGGKGQLWGKRSKFCFLKLLNEGQEIVSGNIHRLKRHFETLPSSWWGAGFHLGQFSQNRNSWQLFWENIDISKDWCVIL